MKLLKTVKNVSLFLGFSSTSFAYASVINIDSLMNAEAKNAIAIKYNACLGSNPSAVKKITCGMFFKNPTISISNVSAVSDRFDYQNLVVSQFPTNLAISSLSVPNCTPLPIQFTNTREVTAQEAATVQKSTSLQTEKSVTFNLPEINLGIVKLSGGSISGKETATNTTGTSNTVTNTLRTSLVLDTVISPYTAKNITIFASKNSASVNYSGDVYLDGQVKLSTIDTPYQYSVLVPNNKVTINGNIFGDYVEKTTIAYSEVALNPATCQPMSQQVSGNTLQKTASSNAIGIVDLSNDYLLYGSTTKSPAQTIKKVVYGSQITTANVIGAIQVRAKTVFTSLCSIKLRTESSVVHFNLIPNSWSEWVTIDNHVGSVVKSLTFEDTCGGDMAAEVRYFE